MMLKSVKSLPWLMFILLAGWMEIAIADETPSRLDRILQRGQVVVATTGDYKPFSHLIATSGTYEGLDIDLARQLGEDLGVEVRFIATSWKTLVPDFLQGRADIALSGITRTLQRQTRVGFTDPYLRVGKSPLVRKADKDRFKTLADIDQPGVRIAVNPGGSNETFLRKNIKRATIRVFEKNLSIPDRILRGEADVIITDNVEAMLAARTHPKLYAVAPDQPYTRDDFGIMTPRDDHTWINWLNLWLHQVKERGVLKRLVGKWIGR